MLFSKSLFILFVTTTVSAAPYTNATIHAQAINTTAPYHNTTIEERAPHLNATLKIRAPYANVTIKGRAPFFNTTVQARGSNVTAVAAPRITPAARSNFIPLDRREAQAPPATR
jgi:hypothetical protein